MTSLRQTPLTCSGHTRPVVFLAFSEINSDGIYYSISACKDGKPMLRQGDTGDWIGTFEGHKGAVWGVRRPLFKSTSHFVQILNLPQKSETYHFSL